MSLLCFKVIKSAGSKTMSSANKQMGDTLTEMLKLTVWSYVHYGNHAMLFRLSHGNFSITLVSGETMTSRNYEGSLYI